MGHYAKKIIIKKNYQTLLAGFRVTRVDSDQPESTQINSEK
jgi:hypothetical protein